MNNKLRERKEQLLKDVLESDKIGTSQNLCIYNLIKNGYLDETIKKLDNKSVKSNVDSNEIYTANEQFLCLLNRLVNMIADDFIVGSNLNIIAKLILEGCKQEYLDEYLLCKYYIGDNSYINFFIYQLARIETNNFYHNIKNYIDTRINPYLIKEKINIKKLDISDPKHVQEIKKLLKKICLANFDDSFEKVFLFDNIDTRANRWLKNDNPNNVSEEQMIYFASQDVFNHVIRLFETYDKTKECLNYLIN